MANSINVNQNNNNVSLQDANGKVTITDNKLGVNIEVTQPVTSIVTVASLGPQGIPGKTQDTGSLVSTSSFNEFTASYYLDSASFNTNISNNSSSISLLSESFETFSGSYNTGSFTGSFYGDGSNLTGIISSKWTGSNPITREGNVEITGSLIISGSSTFINIGPAIFSGSVTSVSGFTGSLLGTAESASYALTASYALNADTSIDTGSFVTTSSFNNFTSSYNDTTGSFVTTSSFDNFTSSYNDTTGSFVTTSSFDNFTSSYNDTTGSFVTTSSFNDITSSFVTTSSLDNITGSFVTTSSFDNFTSSFNDITSSFVTTSSFNNFTSSYNTGSFLGDLNGTASWAENVTSASYAQTASYYGGNVTSASYALTSSYVNPLNQNVIITGSFNVTGSTLQIGNNTLVGNTSLSGSITISGSSTIQGTTTMTGSLNITGSTTQTGNNTLIGTTTLTGSILVNGNIIPQISSSFDLGSITNPWKSLYVQSGSISIQSDIPGGVPAVISNANGDVTIAGAGFQIKSGSSVPFNITPTGLITINTPNSLLTTETAVSIIGSSTGYQQPRNFTGTLLQLTAQDNQPGRVSIDSYGTGAYGLLAGRTARGTVNSPSQSKAGDTLFRISAQGWSNSNSFIGSIVRTDWEAAEDFTATSAGTRLRFQTTPTGSTTIQTSAIIDTTGITIPSTSKFFGTSSWASNAQTASYVNPLNQNVIVSGSVFVSGSVSITNDANLITHNIKALGSNGLQILANNSNVIATMGQGGGSQANFTGSLSSTQFTSPSITGSLFGTSSWAENAQTASYYGGNVTSASYAQTASYINPLNQNVIITGSLKVSGSLTEIGNTVLTGSLTLSSGSALRINNGFYVDGNRQFNYGQFSSATTQSGSANTAYSMKFDTTDFSQGVSLVSGSRLTISNTGLYNIQFSSQLHTTVNQAVDFSIWFAMTGSNIANSNTDFSIEKVSGGGFQVAALNFLTQIQSGSYVELKYSKTTTQGQLQAKGIQAAPTRPATPSIIVTVTQIA